MLRSATAAAPRAVPDAEPAATSLPAGFGREQVLDEAFTAFVQDVALEGPEILQRALDHYRGMLARNLEVSRPTPQLNAGTAIQREIISRLEAAQRHAAALPGEVG